MIFDRFSGPTSRSKIHTKFSKTAKGPHQKRQHGRQGPFCLSRAGLFLRVGNAIALGPPPRPLPGRLGLDFGVDFAVDFGVHVRALAGVYRRDRLYMLGRNWSYMLCMQRNSTYTCCLDKNAIEPSLTAARHICQATTPRACLCTGSH